MSSGGLSGEGAPLRAAVIGYGLAGRVFHAPLIASAEGLEVSAIVTGNPERAAEASEAYPGATIVRSPEELWDRVRSLADFAVVATPNRAHVALARASLAAGVPVVVDKPLATTSEDIRVLIDDSELTGVPLTVFQNRRWDSDFLTLRRLLKEGAIGDVYRYESRFERPPKLEAPTERLWRLSADPDEGGGLLFDLGAHLIDQALVLFGWPDDVYAEVQQSALDAEVDDDTFVALRYASGVVAHLWMSKVTPSPGPRLRVTGSRGAYEHPGLDPQEAALAAGGRPGDVSWGIAPEAEWGRLTHMSDIGPTTEAVPPEAGAYQRFYEEWRDALLGKGPLPVDPRDALKTQAVIDAARRSAAESCIAQPSREAWQRSA